MSDLRNTYVKCDSAEEALDVYAFLVLEGYPVYEAPAISVSNAFSRIRNWSKYPYWGLDRDGEINCTSSEWLDTRKVVSFEELKKLFPKRCSCKSCPCRQKK